MSKKTQQIKQVQIKQSRQRTIKTILRFSTYAILLLTVYVTYLLFASPEAKVASACINNAKEAETSIKLLPEVTKYLKKVKAGYDSPYIKIDSNFTNPNKTHVGYAYIGKKTESNSIEISYKYLFTTGCNAKFQKLSEAERTKTSYVIFDYEYLASQKTYQDQTISCNKTFSKTSKIDLDHDGDKEYLYGCYQGGVSNTVNYYLYDNREGKIYLMDEFKSAGNYEEFADFNTDSYADIATAGIYMDETNCDKNQCFAPHTDKQVKTLLKRSYHRLWNPKTNKFDDPIKAEIYYYQGSQKIVVQP